MQEARSLTGYIDRWIFQGFAIGPRALALCRISFAFYLLFFQFRSLAWVGGYPDIFYVPPPSLARLFSAFPPAWFFEIINGLAVLFLVGILLGYRTRIASIGFALVLLVYNHFAYSFGKIDHSILLVLFPLVMAFSNWGAAWSVDARRGRGGEVQGWPLTLMAILTGFALFTSGFYKLQFDWLNTATQVTQSKIISGVYAWERDQLLALPAAQWQAPWFWELLDWLTVWWELGFLLALFWPRIFRGFIAVGVFFHLGILLTMNIDYSINLLIYTAFIDYRRLRRRLGDGWEKWRARIDRGSQRLHAWMLLPLAALVWGSAWAGGPLWNHFLDVLDWKAPLLSGLLYLGSASVLAVVLVFTRGGERRIRRAR